MTANRIFFYYAPGPHPRRLCLASFGCAAVTSTTGCLVGSTASSADLNAVTLDNRIRQQLVSNFGRHRARLVTRIGGELELEVLALPHILDPAVAERVQGVDDRLAPRIEHRRLQRDEYPRAHQDTPALRLCSGRPESKSRGAATGVLKTRSKILPTFFNCTLRSNASSTVLASRTRMTSASSRSSCLKSFFSSYERSAFRCTHS